MCLLECDIQCGIASNHSPANVLQMHVGITCRSISASHAGQSISASQQVNQYLHHSRSINICITAGQSISASQQVNQYLHHSRSISICITCRSINICITCRSINICITCRSINICISKLLLSVCVCVEGGGGGRGRNVAVISSCTAQR